MKNRTLLIFTSIVLGAAVAPAAFGNTELFWDSDADTTATTGGTGTWDASSSLWRSGTSTGMLQTYDNTAPSVVIANLGGPAGILTIAAGTTINVNKVAIGTTGYTVAGADATTSVLNLSGAAPAIVGNGTTFFTSKITGTSGFSLSGGSFNVFAGDLSGLSGTVSVSSRATMQGTTFVGTNGTFAMTGSQFQEWNVSNILTSNNHGTGTTIQLGALSGSSTGLVRAGNDGTGLGAAGVDIFQVGALNTSTTYAGKIQNFNAGSIAGLTKVGSGTLILSGEITHTGATTVAAGTLTITGTSGTGAIGAINLTGLSGTLNIASSGTLKAASLSQGAAATDAGVLNHTAGTLTIAGDIALGNVGGYGAYAMTGGTLNVVSLRTGSIDGVGNGSGYILQTGGTINVSNVTSLDRNGTGTSVLNIAGAGAVYNQMAGGSNLNLGYFPGGTGIVTVSAGLLAVDTNIVFNNNGSNGILNLNGSITRTNSIGAAALTQANVAAGISNGMSIVNLNGGLLKANVDNGPFMSGLTTANVCSGGARIDTNGKSITIGQSLLGTAGTTGVSGISVASGGSGYLAAPVVSISGGAGTGASAVANVAGGVVTGITITSAGTGYTSSPTVTLTGGGATTLAVLGTIAINTNAADGGLTKMGAGTLTLSGSNTYTGATLVNDGTLKAGSSADVFGSNSAMILADVAGALLDLDGKSVQIGSLTGGGTTGGNVALGFAALTVGGDNTSPAAYAGAISGVGAVIKTGSGILTLSGNNTYSDSTVIEDGTLRLTSTGHLGFLVTDDHSNVITGFGIADLQGAFNIDTSSVTVTSGTWTLVDISSLSSYTYGAGFSPGVGWVENTPNVWKLSEGAKTWTFTEASGVLSLSTSAVSYASWINGFFPSETNPAIVGATADPDHDGIANSVELVIGGNPSTGNNSALLPTCELALNPAGLPAGNYLLFSYRRSDLSVTSSVASNCEYNTGLTAPWTTAVDNVGGVKILVDDNYASFSPPAANTDRVRVFIPKGANTTLFGRLDVKIP